jgi:transposase InsO family protein
MLAQHGVVCSMSRKGNCWDNAVAERFFLNLKMEQVWQRHYANTQIALQALGSAKAPQKYPQIKKDLLVENRKSLILLVGTV